MSDTQQEKPVRYQRGDTIINGDAKHDHNLRYIDLIGSKIIKIVRLPAVGLALEELIRWYLHHH